MFFFIFIALFCGFSTELLHFLVPFVAVLFRTLYVKKSFSISRIAFYSPIITVLFIFLSELIVNFYDSKEMLNSIKMTSSNFIYIKLPLSMFILISLLQNNYKEIIGNIRRIPGLSYFVYIAERSFLVVVYSAKETLYTSNIINKFSSEKEKRKILDNIYNLFISLMTLLQIIIFYVENTSKVIQARGALPAISDWKQKESYGEFFGDILLVFSIFIILFQGLDSLFPNQFLVVREWYVRFM